MERTSYGFDYGKFPYKVSRLHVCELIQGRRVNYLMSEKGEKFRVNTTTAIHGGPTSGFSVVLLFLTFNVKKVCQLEKNTLRNPCMESTSCGLDYGTLPYKVIRLHVSLSKDESDTT